MKGLWVDFTSPPHKSKSDPFPKQSQDQTLFQADILDLSLAILLKGTKYKLRILIVFAIAREVKKSAAIPLDVDGWAHVPQFSPKYNSEITLRAPPGLSE